MTAATPVNEELKRLYAAVDYLTQFEGQDRSLVIEMTLEMLGDLIDGREPRPLDKLVGRYCDVADNRADVERFTAEIEDIVNRAPEATP